MLLGSQKSRVRIPIYFLVWSFMSFANSYFYKFFTWDTTITGGKTLSFTVFSYWINALEVVHPSVGACTQACVYRLVIPSWLERLSTWWFRLWDRRSSVICDLMVLNCTHSRRDVISRSAVECRCWLIRWQWWFFKSWSFHFALSFPLCLFD